MLYHQMVMVYIIITVLGSHTQPLIVFDDDDSVVVVLVHD